ncbi:MAG: GatB/YqeY domain-containing protein [Candidatus Nanopelagicus sp.]
MGLKEKLQSDLTDAIRSKDGFKSGTIRMLLAAITNEEVAGKSAKVLTDAEVITVLSREAKKRREAVEAYTNAKRDDLANKEKDEAAVIALYLPEQLSEADIKKLIADAIAETNASGPAGMGLVMKVLQPKIAGKADGGFVSSLVKAALS